MGEQEFMKWLQEWFEQFMGRFDRLDENLESMSGRYNFLEGERLLDNQDLCQMLHVSKRTLQRYRSTGELKHYTIHHKAYYRESDVEAFIKAKFGQDGDGWEIEDEDDPEEE